MDRQSDRLHQAISIETVGVLFFTLDGRMTDANRTFERMSGYTRDELRSSAHWTMLTPPEYIDVTSRAAADLIARGQTPPYEKEMLRKDGSRWWGLFAPTVLSGSGIQSECVEFIIDITERKRAEAAVRESEARFRGLVDTWAQATWEADAGGIVVTDSPSWRACTGQTLAEWLGCGWLDAVHPDDRAYAERQWRDAIAAHERIDAEFRLRHVSGGYRWTNVRAVPLLGPGGEVQKWLGMNIDIDARKHTEEALRESEARQAFLVRLGDTLRPLTDAGDIQTEACRMLGEHLRANRVQYADIIDESQAVIGHEYRDGLPSLLGHLPVEMFGSTSIAALKRGEPLVVDDAATDPRLTEQARAAYRSVSVAATMVASLIRHGRWVAALGVDMRLPRTWTASEVALLRHVAERTWAAVERGKAEAALAAERATLRATIDAMPVGVWIVDARGGIVHANRQGTAVWGEPPVPVETLEDYFSFQAWWADTGEPVRGDEWAMVRALMTGETVVGQEVTLLRADGSMGTALNSAAPIRDAAGRLIGGVAVEQDITDRKRMEDALRQSEARQSFLLNLTDALRPLGDPSAIQREASRVLRDHLGASRVVYTEVLESGEFEAVASAERPGMAPPLGARHRLVDFGRSLEAEFMEGRITARRDVFADPGMTDDERGRLVALDVIAWANAPLVKDGRLVAMLSAHFSAPHDWSAGELAVIEETAERTWAAVERARAEEALRRAHGELERRVRERTSELAQANASLEAEVRDRRSAEEQIKGLFKRLVSAQEEERRRIARDLHDQLGQQMTAIRMHLERLRTQAEGHPSLAGQAERTQALAEELDRSIDFLTWELRPAALDHLGLAAALRNLVDGWSERFHIPAEYDVIGAGGVRLPADVETNVYRLAQEALHNVYKHAGASRVSVLLEKHEDRLVLAIEDDGRGFDLDGLDPESTGSLGLVSMRERAMLVGGELRIDATPGSGTTVLVRLPLSHVTPGTPDGS